MFLNLKAGFAALLLMLTLLASSITHAELATIPQLKALVTDTTGTLNQSEINQLDAKLKAFETEKGSQIAVLIVSTTQPEDIAQYSIRVVNAWKIGRAKQDDGVLILVAKNDRKMRIEVGRGLEGAIPDLYAKRIIAEEIAPRFKLGDMAGGLNAGVDKVTGLITGEKLAPPSPKRDRFSMGGENSFALFIITTLFLSMFLSSILGRFFGAAATGGISGFVASLAAGAGLGLFWGGAAFVFALVIPWLFGGGGRGLGGGYYGGSSGGGWSSGGSSWGGGGGDFGGGGASGDW